MGGRAVNKAPNSDVSGRSHECHAQKTASFLSKCFGRLTSLVVVLGTTALLLAGLMPGWALLNEQPHRREPKGDAIPRATADEAFGMEGVGVVLLGLGPFARQMKCESAIESLRVNAGWRGPVFLATDAARCFRHSRWESCDLNATIIEVEQNLSFGWTLPSLSATKGNRWLSKSYKMRVLDIVQDPAIRVLVYLDCDILLASGSCLRSFLDLHAMRGWGPSTRIKFFEEKPKAVPGAAATPEPAANATAATAPARKKVHGGFFMVHRDWSPPVLQRWMERLLNGDTHSDQHAFDTSGIEEYEIIDPDEWMYRPQCQRDDCRTVQPRCFSHVHNARCVAYGSSSIQDFVDRWELCTLRGLRYCTPIYMTPFSYTWLPYLSCRKMELGLFGQLQPLSLLPPQRGSGRRSSGRAGLRYEQMRREARR